ncbi:HAD-IB family hydrolase [Xanthomonadaceae bacterium JHOS43]|nr:HAD-IB family hydrolase [Xanthomonadaceae bacterium JHOS43]MCX7562134.1 HAD-IB family hydrolase [Xanthomonadaceae bacterium XH05]
MKLALFDFDGTLTTRETFAAFLRHATPPLRRTLASVLLLPLVPAYRRGWLSGVAMRAMATRIALSGRDASDIADAGEAFARDVIPSLLRPDAIAALRTHRDAGDRVIVVSGAFELYVAPWCAREGVDCLASRLEIRHGRLSGQYLGPQCVGEEKAVRVRALCDPTEFASVHAWGDTPEDAALLALAHRRVYRGKEWNPTP